MGPGGDGLTAPWDLVTLDLDVHRGLRKATWLPGIGEGVRRLKAGVGVALLTDQPSTFTDFLGRWGPTDAICSSAAAAKRRVPAPGSLGDRGCVLN